VPRKELIFFFAILLVGFLDWLTTVTGILYFGAIEINPLLSGLTTSNMAVFSAVKLAVVVISGLAFYKAAAIAGRAKGELQFTRRFLNGGCSVTVLAMTVVVANNMIAVLSL
jgi:hypothetical protein